VSPVAPSLSPWQRTRSRSSAPRPLRSSSAGHSGGCSGQRIPGRSPTDNATAGPVLPDLPDTPEARTRVREDRSDLAPAWAQLAAAIAATSLIWISAGFVRDGFAWVALVLLPLAAAIFLGAILPDVLAARWAQQDADAEEQA
jgi:hypothetical protein